MKLLKRMDLIAPMVQREAVAGASLLEEGIIDGGDQVQVDENGYLSDYANSEEDELTPDEDSDGERNAHRRRGNRMVVSDGTDWTTFEWRVGHRFPNRISFKDAVTRYAIFQGRNLSVVLSDKKRGQRLGARPHWPAKDIIETVKRAYKVIIKKDLAYKVKYQAHRMLHVNSSCCVKGATESRAQTLCQAHLHALAQDF
ncbi:Isoleucine--tRNA ligase [Bienertia sinuspersici]